MWIKETGKIGPDLYVLGQLDNPIYLFGKGKEWTIVEGGLAHMKAKVLYQIQLIVSDMSYIRHWVITHSHYDHCGLLTELYSYFPKVRIYASRQTAKAFQSPTANKIIYQFNKKVARFRNVELAEDYPTITLPNIPVTEVVEGDILALSGHQLEVLSTPGHSKCSLSFYEKATGWLFVSDALGEMITPQDWFPLIFDCAESFEGSLKKIARLNCQYVMLGHKGLLTEETARDAAMNSLRSYYKMYERYAHIPSTDIEQKAFQLSEEYAHHSESFVPRDLHEKSMERFLKLIKI